MPVQTAISIEHQIIEHINKSPYPASSWYVGITENIDQRLFIDHAVPRKNSWYMYRKADNS